MIANAQVGKDNQKKRKSKESREKESTQHHPAATSNPGKGSSGHEACVQGAHDLDRRLRDRNPRRDLTSSIIKENE